MKSVLHDLSEDFIKQTLSEFHKPSQNAVLADLVKDNDKQAYLQGICELSRLHEIVQTHPQETAISLMKDLNVPENVIQLMLQRVQSQSQVQTSESKFTYAWRLDQSVPNVQAVLLNIKNNENDETKTMRMDLSTFHKLRFNVSLLLKEHEALSKRLHK